MAWHIYIYDFQGTAIDTPFVRVPSILRGNHTQGYPNVFDEGDKALEFLNLLKNRDFFCTSLGCNLKNLRPHMALDGSGRPEIQDCAGNKIPVNQECCYTPCYTIRLRYDSPQGVSEEDLRSRREESQALERLIRQVKALIKTGQFGRMEV